MRIDRCPPDWPEVPSSFANMAFGSGRASEALKVARTDYGLLMYGPRQPLEIGIVRDGCFILGRREYSDIERVLSSVAFDLLRRSLVQGYCLLRRFSVSKSGAEQRVFDRLSRSEKRRVLRRVQAEGVMKHALEVTTSSVEAGSLFLPFFVEKLFLHGSEDRWLRTLAVAPGKRELCHFRVRLTRCWLVWETFLKESEVLVLGKTKSLRRLRR
jgi:hypothetical protein